MSNVQQIGLVKFCQVWYYNDELTYKSLQWFRSKYYILAAKNRWVMLCWIYSLLNLAKAVLPNTFLKRVCYIRTGGGKKREGGGAGGKGGWIKWLGSSGAGSNRSPTFPHKIANDPPQRKENGTRTRSRQLKLTLHPLHRRKEGFYGKSIVRRGSDEYEDGYSK